MSSDGHSGRKKREKTINKKKILLIIKDGEEGSLWRTYTCRTPIVPQYLFVNNDGNKIDNADTHLGICIWISF